MMKSGRQIEGAGGNVAHLIVPLVIVFPFGFDLGQDKYPTPRHGSRTRTVSGRVDDASPLQAGFRAFNTRCHDVPASGQIKCRVQELLRQVMIRRKLGSSRCLTPSHMLSCLPCSATAVPWQEQRGLHRTRLLKACWTLWCRHEEATYYRPTSQVSCLVQAVRAGCLADLLALQRVRRRGECSQQCSQREPCSHGLAPWFVVW